MRGRKRRGGGVDFCVDVRATACVPACVGECVRASANERARGARAAGRAAGACTRAPARKAKRVVHYGAGGRADVREGGREQAFRTPRPPR